ncbi:hypothetical protein RRG08_019108 [Elysia crispata]|uniref:Uncharacterized protein n=1 Tax=Elysia crispata TaxID=231223 RepID=A0AAE1DTW9_9GAST|nr:hypothetical protein RRG08_019108 [Elysia crispata]
MKVFLTKGKESNVKVMVVTAVISTDKLITEGFGVNIAALCIRGASNSDNCVVRFTTYANHDHVLLSCRHKPRKYCVLSFALDVLPSVGTWQISNFGCVALSRNMTNIKPWMCCPQSEHDKYQTLDVLPSVGT